MALLLRGAKSRWCLLPPGAAKNNNNAAAAAAAWSSALLRGNAVATPSSSSLSLSPSGMCGGGAFSPSFVSSASQRPPFSTPPSPSSSFTSTTTLHPTLPLRLFHAAAAAVPPPQSPDAAATAPLDPQRVVKRLRWSTQKTPIPDLDELGFCRFFSDHMLEVDWDRRTGWGPPLIRPFANISIHPASSGLHYGVQAFDGIKCFRAASSSLGSDSLLLFRPDRHINRLHVSSQRLTLPSFDKEALLELVKELIRLDEKWVPNKDGFSIYVRPYIFSTQPALGVAPPGEAKLVVTLSPCGPYFPTGFKPVQIKMETKYNRSFPGGVGDCKAGGNYAPTLLPQLQAAEEGFSQVLWLYPDGDDLQMTEVGCMNFFLFWINEKGEKELATPPLTNNLILPGVTRESVLALAKEDGSFKVSERVLYVKKDFLKAHAEGRILEAFGSGTAAVLSPIDLLSFDGKKYPVPLDKSDPTALLGPLCKKLIHQIYDIQYGRTPHEWAVRV